MTEQIPLQPELSQPENIRIAEEVADVIEASNGIIAHEQNQESIYQQPIVELPRSKPIPPEANTTTLNSAEPALPFTTPMTADKEEHELLTALLGKPVPRPLGESEPYLQSFAQDQQK